MFHEGAVEAGLQVEGDIEEVHDLDVDNHLDGQAVVLEDLLDGRLELVRLPLGQRAHRQAIVPVELFA